MMPPQADARNGTGGCYTNETLQPSFRGWTAGSYLGIADTIVQWNDLSQPPTLAASNHVALCERKVSHNGGPHDPDQYYPSTQGAGS